MEIQVKGRWVGGRFLMEYAGGCWRFARMHPAELASNKQTQSQEAWRRLDWSTTPTDNVDSGGGRQVGARRATSGEAPRQSLVNGPPNIMR